jgi:O-antigen/teichoic acid export membrane protein
VITVFIRTMGTIIETETLASSRREQLLASLRGWLPWVGKGSLAITDQGLFAGSNFLLNVLLARWLEPADYGAFALAYCIFLLLGVVHTATLTEPMLVFGPGKYRECFPEYLGILLRGHFALILPGAALLAVTAFLLGWLYSPVVGRALLALAIAGPFILLLWLQRRAFYVRLDPRWAAAGSGGYFLILLAGILILRIAGHLTPSTGLLAMAAASFITCPFLLVALPPMLATSPSLVRAVAADHWRYGRWASATAGAVWLSSGVYFLVLPPFVGLAQSGALKALWNLATPALNCVTALSTILLPHLSHIRQLNGVRGMARTMCLALAVFLSGSAVQLILLWNYRIELFQFLYAGKYEQYASWPLLLVALLPFGWSLPAILGAGLQALEHPDKVFWSCAVGSCVAVTLGVALTARFGVSGALGGMLVSSLATTLTMIWFYQRTSYQDATSRL